MVLAPSVVIDNLDIRRPSRILRPFKTNPPLVVDADAVLSGPVAPQGFQPITRQAAQVAQTGRRAQDFEPFVRLSIEAGKGRHALSCGKLGRSFVFKSRNNMPAWLV
jgi:hypothetical protein